MSPSPPPPSAPPRRRGRVRRWIGRALLALGGVCLGLVAAVFVLLHSLDRAWLKRRILAAARASSGLDIDYRHVGIDLFSGATLEGVIVKSPEEERPFAPDLVRVDRIEARWRVGSFFGHGSLLDRVAISGLKLTVVVDEHGRTSFDAIPSTGPSAPPSPPVPISQQAGSVLGSALPVAQVDVEGVSATLIKTEQGVERERTNLEGVGLALRATSALPAEKGARLGGGLGSPGAPLDLRLTRARAGAEAAAHAKLWLTLDATSSAVKAALDLRVPEQSFAQAVPADHWLHAEAALKFDPAAGRTAITLDQVEAGDGAARAEAVMDLPDTGDPLVRHAQGDIDLARLLGWIPPGLVPVTAASARVHFRAESLIVGPVVRFAAGGNAALDLDLSNVIVTAGPEIHVAAAKASLHAQPDEGGGLAARGTVSLTGTEIGPTSSRLALDDLQLDFDGHQAADGAIGGQLGLRFGVLTQAGATPVVAHGGHLALHVDALHPGQPDPLATRGDLAVSFDLASLDARTPGAHLTADGAALRLHTRLEGHAPYAAELDLPIARLRAVDPRGAVLLDAPTHLQAKVREATPDRARPAASVGVAHLALDAGEIKTALDVTKKADAVDFALSADLPSLKQLRPLVPPSLLKQTPWDQIGIALHSTGHADRITSRAPALEQTSELTITRPAFERTAAQSVALTLHSKGNARAQEGNLDLRALGLSINGGKPEDDHAALTFAFNRDAPSLQFELATDGRASTKIAASASFDAARHALPYTIDVHLAGLAPIAPLLAAVHGLEGFDLAPLDLTFSSHGTVLGALSGIGADGSVQLAPDVIRTVGVEGVADLHVAHFQWTRGSTGIIAPAIAWHGELHSNGERRKVDSHLEAGALHLDLGPHDVDVADIRHDSSLTVIGRLSDPESEVTQRTSLRSVIQDFVPAYAIGDFNFALTAERDAAGVIHLTEMKIANAAGGTTLGVTGNLDLGDGRRTLSVTTELGQDLASLTRGSERMMGRGKLAVTANVTSPDLELFRVRSSLKAEDVFFQMPKAGIDLEAASGEIPVTVALEANKSGVALRADEKRSPYSMLRFADQHPLLSRSGFLSIASLKTPFITIAPLVGNLEIEQNVISLRQFEMGIHKGTVTGQCSLNWDGPKSSVELHVRASGVQSSHGEPFDGNIAVVISAADRTVEGRAEILRIGERHLLDLLDLQDPLHVDPSINRVRMLLGVGYPDTMRLSFDHGFASAHLKFGGLARIVSVDLRGIPMGPLIDKVTAPLLDGLDSPPAAPADSDDSPAPEPGKTP